MILNNKSPTKPAEPGGGMSTLRGDVCRVLIVEDDSPILKLISTLVTAAGWLPVPFTTGEEALKVLQEDSFDLAVLDLMLPGVSGMEVLRHLHHHYPDTKTIVVTGYSSVEGAVEAMRQGAFNYLPKPFRGTELTDALRQALDAGRKAREDREQQERLKENYIQNRIETEIRRRAKERSSRELALQSERQNREPIH